MSHRQDKLAGCRLSLATALVTATLLVLVLMWLINRRWP